MYGGVLQNGEIVADLWTFDLTSHNWEWVNVAKGSCLDELCGPLPATGHSGTVVTHQGKMLILFGHSALLGFLNTVQEYDFGSYFSCSGCISVSPYCPGLSFNDSVFPWLSRDTRVEHFGDQGWRHFWKIWALKFI